MFVFRSPLSTDAYAIQFRTKGLLTADRVVRSHGCGWIALAEVVLWAMASQVCFTTASAECATCEKTVSPLSETTVTLLTFTRPPKPVSPFLLVPLSNNTA